MTVMAVMTVMEVMAVMAAKLAVTRSSIFPVHPVCPVEILPAASACASGTLFRSLLLRGSLFSSGLRALSGALLASLRK